MTQRTNETSGGGQGDFSAGAPAPPLPQQQETVVTHGSDRDSVEQRSVGGPAVAAGRATAAPAGIATSRTVVQDEVGSRQRRIAQIRQIIWFAIGLFEVLLGLRLILKLTGAGEAADFTQLIFGVTRPLVMPFLGIFPSAGADAFEFEPASVVAMVVYLLVGWGLVRLVRIFYGETRDYA